MGLPTDRGVRTEAVLFDLLTALLDSWAVWKAAAGSEEAGLAWRTEYLRLTYGCGAYQPYEALVSEAARRTGLGDAAATRLVRAWDTLPPWSGAQAALDALVGRVKLAVVTNCSQTLGRRAADLFNVPWDTVVTAEEAGYYKPDRRPYELALARLGVAAPQAAFVAGSGYDLFGTHAVGLRTYWHNRIGLQRPHGAPPAAREEPTLDLLPAWAMEEHST
jgi:2-haloacid dehalogenase